MAKHSGSYYAGAAESSGLVTVKPGNGDHLKFYAKPGALPPGYRNPMICPSNLKGYGTECAIKKWLAALGIFVVLAAAIITAF